MFLFLFGVKGNSISCKRKKLTNKSTNQDYLTHFTDKAVQSAIMTSWKHKNIKVSIMDTQRILFISNVSCKCLNVV